MNKIQGFNCHLEYETQIRLETREKINCYFSWLPVGNPNGTEEEKFAYFLSDKLPSQEFYNDFSALDQAIYWQEAKQWSILVALSFLNAKISSPSQEEARLQNYLDEIHLSAKYYQNHWDFLKRRWKKISPHFKIDGDQASTKLELMKRIATFEVNGQFATCFKEQHQDNLKETKILATLSRKESPLSTSEKKRLKDLSQKYVVPNPWLGQLFRAYQSLAQKGDAIALTHLEIHSAIQKGMSKLLQDEATQGWASSFTWVNGRKFPGLVCRSASGEIRNSRRNNSLQ
jgi:hypothetical protein